MNAENKQTLLAMHDALDKLLTGKNWDVVKITSSEPELQKLADKINELIVYAAMDSLTCACNRKAGLEELEKILIHKEPKGTHCIVFVDIDDLKQINDLYGHSEGDYTIKSIAKELLSSVRSTDTVCRYGGDEFLIILKNCEEEAAKKIVSEMTKNLKRVEKKNPKPYRLAFSHGIIPFSNCEDPVIESAELLKLADEKMYLLKNKRKQQRLAIQEKSNA